MIHRELPKRHRTGRVIATILLILVMLVVALGAGYLLFLHLTVTGNMRHESMLANTTAGDPSPGDSPSSANPSSASPSPEVPPAKTALDVLLIGSDSRTSIANGRSDVIILAHVSGDRKKVYLVHFPRDMYVEVPGHGKDKINASYAYGGPQLLVRTLTRLIDVHIDHMAVVGFEGFEAMTDAVGGVDVYAEEASDNWGIIIHAGMNHLDGKTALGFVRERYQLSQGDISRGRRQMEFVRALLLKVLSKETLSNPVRFAKLVRAATSNLTVDSEFSAGDLYALALSMRSLRSQDIAFVTAPISGFGRSPTGASIDIVDTVKMAQLSEALKNDAMGSYPASAQTP